MGNAGESHAMITPSAATKPSHPNEEGWEISGLVPSFWLALLLTTIARVTYRSELRRPTGTERASRASHSDRTSGRWQLRFHQGTPCEGPA